MVTLADLPLTLHLLKLLVLRAAAYLSAVKLKRI